MKNKIAVVILNFVQFYSLKPFLDLNDKYNIDIYVLEFFNDKSGFNDMFNDLYNYLRKNKYNVYRKAKKTVKYKILLEPYPMISSFYDNLHYDYRLKYKYASISAKPRTTYNIQQNLSYDAILVHSTYEEEVMANFSKTFLVGRLCFNGFKRKNNRSTKKTILYLPTYGDLNYIDEVVGELKHLSDDYNIITKEHHGTNYLHSETKKSEELKNVITKFYDSSYPLSKLLEIADVVLTDNSGSIFDSLYTNIPVCIFSKDIEKCNFNNLESLQYQLVKKDIIPFTNDAKSIETIIKKALSSEYISKQKQISKRLFPINTNNTLTSFTKIIDNILDSDDVVLNNRIVLHREIEENYYLVVNENNELTKALNNMEIENKKLNSENWIIKNKLNEYENGKLYKFSKKLYSIKSKLRRKK